MNKGVLRKCLGLVSAALVLSSASQACSGATLTITSFQPMIWRTGTPRSAPSPVPGSTLKANISAEELLQLSSHDVVLIIDKSHSMTKADCLALPSNPQLPSPRNDDHSNLAISRWQWCQEQTLDLKEKTKGGMPAGITVVVFSGESEVYNNVDVKTIETIFSGRTPKGNTNTTLALKGQLDQYFERKGRLGESVKPLLIAVITDGCPDEPYKLRYAIIDATRKMRTADEISITFLQVGNDPGGSTLLNELDSGLIARKAKFDIVDVKPFTELCKIGLARALVSEATRN